jgi:acyl carrier protein
MEKIRNRLLYFIKEIIGKENYDIFIKYIDNDMLSLYMDSLDIVDLVIEIEKHYDITIDDYNDWDEMYLDDIVKYIKNKLG